MTPRFTTPKPLRGLVGALRGELVDCSERHINAAGNSATGPDTSCYPDLTTAYNLNVVYFIPDDIPAPAEYHRRISELMLWIHNFFAANMERNGFGRRSFGLRTLSADSINLITINGQHAHDSYPYSGGSGSVMSEINTYFAENPNDKESTHTLIIIPSYSGDSLDPGGPPFYGTGRNCFALDYEHMDIQNLGENSTKGNLLTKWFGGLVHELGHGLNLPHNRQLVSQLNSPSFGTTLMGSGNYTLGKTPTYLSKASCALLNNCQVFSSTEKPFYQSGNSVKIEAFHIEHNAQNITVRGEYTNASKPINAVNIYVDDFPFSGVNENYDAESWSITSLANDEFSIAIPLNEIGQTNNQFRVRTWFLFNDGTYFEKNRDFNRTSLQNYHYIYETVLSKAGWEAFASSSALPASNLLDNNKETYWHSQWQGQKPDHPHTIRVDMKEVKTIRGLSFVQRQSFHVNLNQFTIETSADGTTWQAAGTHNLLKEDGKQFIYLPEAREIRQFRITTISNHSPGDPKPVALAEIGAFE